MSDVEIPKKCTEGSISSEEVVLEVMRAFEKNKTWRVMTLRIGKNTVGCK